MFSYGLKDYKWTSQEFKKATEDVLKECKKRGIRVISFVTDGQWIQNMVRDAANKQKDVWDSVQ